MTDWREEEARHQTIFREMNEWTEEENDDRLGIDRVIDTYMCECSDPRCTDPINLTRDEYESIRKEPIRFAIAVHHENPEIDWVLAEFPRFTIVEKMLGPAARVALATDPRR